MREFLTARWRHRRSMSALSIALSALAFFLSLVGAFAQTNIVSRPVGFVRVEVPAQSQTLVSLPFEPFDENVNAVLAGQLTGGINAFTADAILKWDGAGYERAYETLDGKWRSSLDAPALSDMTILPGEGFCILNRQDNDQTVILSGEVVLAATNETSLLPGMNLIGYPFSTGARLADTALRGKVKGADVLELGKGYWREVAGDAAVVWSEVRPYAADVFPSDDGTPQITGVSVIDGGSAVKLTIRAEGVKGELLDIFYKDVSVTNLLDTLKGWQIAASDLVLNGKTEVAWEDHGGAGRPSVNQVEARYYLVGRADMDSDGDGVPDARERFVCGAGFGCEATSSAVMSRTTTGGMNLDGAVDNAQVAAQSAAELPRGGKTVYVDRAIGDDTHSGASLTAKGQTGPKRTINAGIRAAISGDVIVVRPGEYHENVSLPDGIKMICEGRVVMN